MEPILFLTDTAMRLDLGNSMKDCSDNPLRSIQRMCYRINVYILQCLFFVDMCYFAVFVTMRT